MMKRIDKKNFVLVRAAHIVFLSFKAIIQDFVNMILDLVHFLFSIKLDL